MEKLYKKAYVILRNKQKWNISLDHPMYCCRSWIDGWVNETAVPVSYNPWRRLYYIMVHKKTGWMQIFLKCVCCDTKFPEDLIEIREKVLEEEYGVTEYPMEINNKKIIELGIQEEFFTEQWWRKRGL